MAASITVLGCCELYSGRHFSATQYLRALKQETGHRHEMVIAKGYTAACPLHAAMARALPAEEQCCIVSELSRDVIAKYLQALLEAGAAAYCPTNVLDNFVGKFIDEYTSDVETRDKLTLLTQQLGSDAALYEEVDGGINKRKECVWIAAPSSRGSAAADEDKMCLFDSRAVGVVAHDARI